MRKFLLILALLGCSCAAQVAADVYVSTTGNDSTGTGSFAAPYATVDKARQAIDTVIAASGCGGGGRTSPYVVALRGVPTPSGFATLVTASGTALAAGTYYQGSTTLTKNLSFTSSDSGCAGFPVVYQSYPGETAIISGGIRVTGWTATGYTCGGTCTQYSVALSSTQPYFESLFYNGNRRFRPRLGASPTNTCGSSGATCPNLALYYRQIGQITGSWQSSFAYVTGDITTRTSVTYIAIANNTNSPPPNSNWATYTGPTNALVAISDACTGCGNSPNPTTNLLCTPFPTATTNCIDRLRYGTIGSPAIAQWNNILVSAAGIAYNIASNGITVASNVVTITTTTGNVGRIGQQISLAGITGCTTVANGTNVAAVSTITGTTISYALTAANQTCGGSGGTITFQDPQNDIELQDWEFYTAPRLRIAGIDTTTGEQIISFSGTFSTTSETNNGPLNSHRFIVENEQDDATHYILQPQQWFVDRSHGRPWTLYYNAATGENPNTDAVEIPWFPQIVVANALQYAIFRGIVFKDDNFLIPNNGYIDSQGEPNIPGATDCQNCNNVTFEFGGFTNVEGDGLEMIPCRDTSSVQWCSSINSGATTANDLIQHNSFWDCGANCLQIGNSNVASDTDTNVPNNISVVDNLFDGWGRLIPGAFGFNLLDSNTILISHNDGMDGYHSAVSVCIPACPNGTSNSHGVFNITASYNHLWSCMEGVTDDGGCLYFAIGGGNGGTQSGTANRMVNNKIHDVNDPGAIGSQEPTPNGGHCIYLDNQSANVDVENNVVYRCSADGIFLSKGVIVGAPNGQNTLINNLLAYMRNDVLTTGTPTAWFANADSTSCTTNLRQHVFFARNIAFFDRTYLSSGGGFNIQAGCAYACGGGVGATYLGFQNWFNNFYYKNCGTTNICLADSGSQTAGGGVESSDVCAFHVSTQNANLTTQGPSSGTCHSNAANWVFGTAANWQAGALVTPPTSCAGTGSSTTPDVQSTGEDSGSLVGDAGPTGTQIPWTNSGQQGYPNDNYLITQNSTLTGIGFNAAKTNATLNNAGRLTNTGFLPTVTQTYPVYTYDPNHTNNGDF